MAIRQLRQLCPFHPDRYISPIHRNRARAVGSYAAQYLRTSAVSKRITALLGLQAAAGRRRGRADLRPWHTRRITCSPKRFAVEWSSWIGPGHQGDALAQERNQQPSSFPDLTRNTRPKTVRKKSLRLKP